MPAMRMGNRAQVAREAIAQLSDQKIPTRELLDEVGERVQKVVQADSGGWWTSDPETLLPSELWNFTVEDMRRELSGDDQYDPLDRAGRSVIAVGRNPTRRLASGEPSPVSPVAAKGSTMRVLARSGGSSWGMACISRGEDLPDFTDVETRFVSLVAAHVGDAIRASLGDTAITSTGSETGTLILDADNRAEGVTRDARYWLGRLGVAAGAPLPAAMQWTALQAHARERLAATGRIVRPARVRMPLNDGTWLLVQADTLSGGDGAPRTALTLRPAGRADLLPLQLAVYGLTPREAEVSRMLIDGQTTAQIATALNLSRHTVGDHTKAVYKKAGVNSRPQLTALLSAGGRTAA